MSKYSESTLMRFAKDNKLARVVAQPDACRYCKDFHGRIYLPSEAPEIPIRGCTGISCRCQYEPIDADTPQEELLLSQGISASKMGRKEEARKFLTQVVELDDDNEQAWLWLSGCVDEPAERVRCLEKVLAINPANELAQAGLKRLWDFIKLAEAESQPPEAEAKEITEEGHPPPEAKEPPAVLEEGGPPLPSEPPVESHLLSRLRSLPAAPSEAETLVMPWPKPTPPSEAEVRETFEERQPPPPQGEAAITMPEIEPLPPPPEEAKATPTAEAPTMPLPAPSPEVIPKTIACPRCATANSLTQRKCTRCGKDLLPGRNLSERIAQLACGGFFCFLAYLAAVFTQREALTSLRVNLEVCAVSGFVFLLAAFIAAFAMEGHLPWQGMPLADRYRRRAERYRETDPGQAIADYSQALELTPDNGQLYRSRAELYEGMGYTKEALEDYKLYRHWAALKGKGSEANFAAAQIERLRRELAGII